MLRWLRRSRSGAEAASSAGAGWAFDPRDPDYVRDPYPYLAALREHEPVHRSAAGPYVLTRYKDVHRALEDPRLSNAPARYAVVHERNRDRYVCADVAAHILPFLDPPTHTTPRRVIGRAFVERLRHRPPDIEGLARSLLERWRGAGERDVVADYASPLAVAVIADVLGVPREDATELERWSESFFYLFAAIPSEQVRSELDRALTDLRAYLRDLVRERRRRPTGDLLSMLAHADEGEDALADAEIVDNCMLLFADGLENVDRAIGNAVYALLRHPAQLERLAREPELLGSAVDECLRYESPAQYIGRIALEEVELHGVTVPAGSTLLLVLGSANRDPRVFEDPDVLDIGRSPNSHLAFGRARHSCIGGPLVELQMRAALGCLLGAFPDLEPAIEDVPFVPRPAHRWVERVPVRPNA